MSSTLLAIFLFALYVLFAALGAAVAGGYLARRSGASYPEAVGTAARAFSATLLIIAGVVAAVAACLKS
ncbi:hypothetical protein [Streptomyces viridochromogenes]|uniref:hypothetical protein n=1 Tax=Streptomyces viridochromogenes TaxID=1938 RepID=UPI000D14936A|nr:hypothetical protein [Streptomyces viridochromogenes]